MHDGIAIIGMSCRFAGARNLEEFWQVLSQGKNTIFRGLAEEQDEGSDVQTVDAFGVLEDIDQFDNRLFGITAREAAVLDPQQRIWQELVWHALEDAGLGARQDLVTGVFASCNRSAYLENNILRDTALRDRLRTQITSETRQIRNGNEREFLPLRTSFAFGFSGPSINIQTACSSALVAVASACRVLASGEADICIAGGMSIARTTDEHMQTEPNAIHSPTGLCRPFDAKADGAVFGDGGGVVILRRAEDALKDRQRVYSVIRGWGVTNDGGSKPSFVAPKSRAQALAIQKAWAMAKFDVRDVSYIEAHGTGTCVGDPVEFEGINRALGEGEIRCSIGSVKSNIGHTDTAAGIAGLIKTGLMLHRRSLVPTVNFEHPNPLIGFEQSRFRVARDTRPWIADGQILLAGVTALGVGGTNCHLALSEARTDEEPEAARPVRDGLSLLVLSGQSLSALQRLIPSYINDLPEQRALLCDFCRMATVGRRHLPYRMAVLGRNKAELVAELRQRSDGLTDTALGKPSILFAFTGQFSSYAGMAQELYEREPTFRMWIETCADILDPLLGKSLWELLFSPGNTLKQTRYEQPVLCALQISMAEMWKQLGILPAAVLGYSVGELAAAYCANAAPLESLLKFAVKRGEAMENIENPGFMISVHASADEIAQVRDKLEFEIAAYLGPSFCIVSGNGSVVETLRELSNMDFVCRVLSERYGFHSQWLNETLPALKLAAAEVAWSRPKVTYLSTLTGRIETRLHSEYWIKQARSPIVFNEALTNAADAGCDLCLEIGPDRILSTLSAHSDSNLTWLHSCNHALPDWEAHLHCLAGLYEAGAEIDWPSRSTERPQKWVDLPKYPFERKSFWIGPKPTTPSKHSTDKLQFEAVWSTQNIPFLSHHSLFGQTVVPASHHIAWILNTIADHFGHDEFSVKDWVFHWPVKLTDASGVQVVMTLEPDTQSALGKSYHLEMCVAQAPKEDIFISAHLDFCAVPFPEDLDMTAGGLDSSFPAPIDGNQFYTDNWVNNDGTGDYFRRIESIWSKTDHAVAKIKSNFDAGAEILDAPVIEAGFQSLHAGTKIETRINQIGNQKFWIPHSIDRITYRHQKSRALKWCRAIHHPDLRNTSSAVGTINFFDAAGKCLVDISGFHLRPIKEVALSKHKPDTATYQLAPEAVPLPPENRSVLEGTLVVVSHSTDSALRNQIEMQIREYSQTVFLSLEEVENGAADHLQTISGNPLLNVVFVQPCQTADESFLRCKSLYQLVRTLSELMADIQSFAVFTAWKDETPDPEIGAVEGLARVIMNEYPHWGVKLINQSAATGPKERAREICREISVKNAGVHVIYRGDQRFQNVLRPLVLSDVPVRLKANRSYLVVGPSDPQTEILKEWLIGKGAGHAEILTVCSDPAKGDSVRSASECSDIAAFLNPNRYPHPIAGLFFIPWGTEVALIDLKTWENFHAETNQCAHALQILSSASETLPLDHFVCFSSSAAVLGAQGQASYAALTSFMDLLCVKRQHRGFPALSLNWGPWDGAGTWALTAAGRQAVAKQGWRLLNPGSALHIMARAMAGNATVVSVLPIDWNQLASSGFVRGLSLPNRSRATGQRNMQSRPAIDELAALIGEDIASYPEQTCLVELGLDSLMAVRLRNSIKRTHGTDIPVAHLLATTTIAELKKLDETLL